MGLCWVSAITQEPNKNPIPFLEWLKEALQKFTNLDLDSYKGQVILKDKFLSQCASDIRIKLQQLQQQDPAASSDEMVQTATNTFYNREQEREAKTQERDKRKETNHAQMLAALQGSPMANSESLKGSSVQFSHSVMSYSLRPHELQHTRPPCPSPTPELTQTQVH